MKNRIDLVKILSSFILCGSVNLCMAEEKRPNILIFLVDDLGWNDTSLPMSGEKTKYNNRYKTPNLERLAQEGMMLTNAHAQALSVPSRASLITGQNSIHNGISGDYKPTINHNKTFEIEPGRVLDHRFTLPKLLKQSGYKTIHCGKYHLCEYESHLPTPTDIGFDVNIAGSLYGQPGSYQPEDDYTRKGMLKNGKNLMVGLDKYYGSKKHLTEALTEVAIDEINNAVKADKPFFLYMAHYAVHTPIQPHQKHINKYQLNAGEKVDEINYGSMITGIDASLGTFMHELDKLGITDNTLILFCSDNGGRVLWRGKKSLYGNYEFNYPLRSGKASIYEGGIRIPAVARWPKKIKKNAISDAPIMIEDIYSTVLNAANVSIPSNHATDGKNLMPLFSRGGTNKDLTERDMYFYLPYRFDGAHFNGKDFADGGVTPSAAVIHKNWKLIYFHIDQSFELYNLKTDIGEKNNLISVEKKIASKLVAKLDTYLRSNNAINSIKLPERIPTPWPLDVYKKN